MIYIDDKKYLNLPEQVQQNIEDIKAIAAAQDDDHDAINTNTNDINSMKTQIASVESITLKGDETNNKAQLYRSNKADMGSVQFKTVNGNSLIGEGDIQISGADNAVTLDTEQTITGIKHVKVGNTTLENIVCYEADTIFEKITTFKNDVNFDTNVIFVSPPTFKKGLKVDSLYHINCNQLANTNDNAMVRYRDTENEVVLGGSTTKALIMGSEDRPTYSKDGSDFKGTELALISDNYFNFVIKYRNANELFLNYKKINYEGLKSLCLDTSMATNMYYMFGSCSSLTTIPLLNTSNVTNMTYMFNNCSSLTTIPLLNTSNVTDMAYMFNNCSSLTTIPQLNANKVTYMSNIFTGCKNLTQIDMINIGTNLDITDTALGHNALTALIANLKTVTSTKTLTMGSAKLALLSDSEKAVATNKGWALA